MTLSQMSINKPTRLNKKFDIALEKVNPIDMGEYTNSSNFVRLSASRFNGMLKCSYRNMVKPTNSSETEFNKQPMDTS